MKPSIVRLLNFIFVFFGIVCFIACRSSCSTNHREKYSIHIMDMDAKEYVVTTNNLDAGLLKPEEITEALPDSIFRNIIVKDGFYYSLQRKSDILTKYTLKDRKLFAVAHLQLQDYNEENFLWMGKDSLLLSGLNNQANEAKYYLVDTKGMKTLAAGLLDINKPQGKFKTTSIGFVHKRKDTLFIGYTFHPIIHGANYTTSDTMYISRLTYPQMKRVGIQKEIRSTYPAGINTVQHNEFTDEYGNFYFMSCPGIAMGNRADLPTAIFKINANSSLVDSTYFFNLSSSTIKNHAYGLWYVGNGKAIVRSERKDLYKGLSDHYSTSHFEFYLLDIVHQKVIKKLDLPLDKGTRKECVLVNGDTVHIAVNSTTDGNFIWQYNLKTDELRKGLQLGGVSAFIVRIDRLLN
ncbi:hypothetical protein OQZ33_21725 [Pedobacter sp. MC2016-05]|uniref:hypothetical protein n=1 Tax=Pedobacter sp. MC2016-05 TaxID=2994474 RepID=UPI0022471AC5|nr:hypothetical protein [Pedobacter sp. MC2016-05]MCX2476968.1 hypothetical protein [Pedobacter sp. MC2016-05]